MKKEVIVVPYDPSWPQTFKELEKVYEQGMGPLLLDIQHVGSTSVPGLTAKPKIDIDLIVEDQEKKRLVIQGLQAMGYVHVGDLGIPGREAFKRADEHTPRTEENRLWPAHNLYVCIKGLPALLNHLYFRDYLREHQEEAKTYGELKRKLAQAYPEDIDKYIEGKTPFIIEVLRKAGFPAAELDAIIERNKAPN